jgi:type VI protein secretion system component Hcp
MTTVRQVGPKHILNMVKHKDKVVPLLKQHAMKGSKGVEAQLHTFLLQ